MYLFVLNLIHVYVSMDFILHMIVLSYEILHRLDLFIELSLLFLSLWNKTC